MEEKTFITRVEYLRRGDKLIAYLRTAERCDMSCIFAGERLAETSNLREPFDFRLHTVPLDASALAAVGVFTVVFTKRGARPSEFFTESVRELRYDVTFDAAAIVPAAAAEKRGIRGLILEEVTEAGGMRGVDWEIETYRTPDGKPVRVYTAVCDPQQVSFVAGTPNAEPVFIPKVIATVMEEAEAAEKKTGRRVLAATNADFFDMFGDCKPSGLCVHGGQIIANPDSPNPFFGVTRDGKPVIGRIDEYPAGTLAEAVGGGQIILRDGKTLELAPLEPFGEISHPRTAFGLTGDGHVIIMVVDGRRPVWSNGAALPELAELMLAHGAVTAMNADGGGSSTFIVRRGDSLEMLNHPADLVRPMEDLIRPLYNSLLVLA